MDVDVWPAQLPLMPRKYLATTFHVQGVPEVRIPEIDRESITNEVVQTIFRMRDAIIIRCACNFAKIRHDRPPCNFGRSSFSKGS